MLLTVNNMHVSYGAIKALQGISISVKGGDCIAIVGGNGAGKTTLLKIISGLLKPSEGSITFNNKNIVGMEPYNVAAEGIAHVPEGRRVFSALSVLDNLIMGSYLPSAKKDRSQSLEYMFSLFPKLEERQHQLAGTLSGGEQQMLAVARGLMLKPKLLMLDEPSSGLAPIIVEQMYEKLAEVHAQSSMTMIVVEQNVPVALSLADRGYVLENGSVMLSGNSNDLLNNPGVKEAYLGF